MKLFKICHHKEQSMDLNIIGLIISYVFAFFVIGFASLFLMFKVFDIAIVRKIVHIGVSNWWILAMTFFNKPIYPIIGAGSFIIINYISKRKHIFQVLESPVNKENLGTIYYPISLVILSILCFGGYIAEYIGAIGILVLGYGDGLASIIGIKKGKRHYKIFGSQKSFIGSITMFVVSFLITIIILSMYNPEGIIVASLSIAAIATLLEGLTPFGMDNLTVPLGSSLAYYFLFIYF